MRGIMFVVFLCSFSLLGCQSVPSQTELEAHERYCIAEGYEPDSPGLAECIETQVARVRKLKEQQSAERRRQNTGMQVSQHGRSILTW